MSDKNGSVKRAMLLMEEILHQLRLVVFPIMSRVFYISGGAGFLPSTVSHFENFIMESVH